MQNLENLSKVELKELLKNLKKYNDLVTKVGKRGKDIFENIFEGKNKFVVEYFTSLEEDYVYDEASKIYKKLFGIEVTKDEISFIKTDKVLGGMKLYMNDKMVDMSFLKFYNLISK